MDFKKLWTAGILLLLVVFGLEAKDSIIKDRFLTGPDDIVRFAKNTDTESQIVVSRLKGGEVKWEYRTGDVTFFAEDHRVPPSAYAVYGNVVTFPVSVIWKDGKSEKLKRTQIALDRESGEVLWEKEIVCGVHQKYFYSYSDGENLFIHNLHEYKGSQFLCLNLKSGEKIWEKECLPQPAMFLDRGDSFILHSGLLREFRIYSKSDGSFRSYATSSPVKIWNGKPLFTRLEKVISPVAETVEICRILTLSPEGEEEELFSLPSGSTRGVWTNNSMPYRNFSKNIEKPAVPSLLYNDSLIFQMKNGEESYQLVRYSLKENEEGKEIWRINLPREIVLRTLFSTNFSIPYNFNRPLCPTYSELLPFHITKGGFLPVFFAGDQFLLSRFGVIDLNKGQIVTIAPNLSDPLYLHNLTLKSGDDFFIFLQQYSENDEGESYVLRFSGEEGRFVSYISFPNDILDTPDEMPQTAPIYYLLQEKPDYLNWLPIGEELKEKLKADPGFEDNLF